MAIIVDGGTRILIQGITGPTGRAFTARLTGAGTPPVAGVTPGKGGQRVEGVPVFDSVSAAVAATGATAALTLLGPGTVKEGVLEAVAGGLRVVVAYAENTPVHDALAMVAHARAKGCRLLGPNSAGVVSAGLCNLSDLDARRVPPGPIGVVSKSGTLTYELLDGLADAGLGVTTVVCLGGDRVLGTAYADVLELFAADPATEVVALIGEPGGGLETLALPAALALGKPLVAYFAGRHSPPERRMGHAGAILAGPGTSAAAKADAYQAAGLPVAGLLPEVVPMLSAALRNQLT
jgi:succinyl-CoA synthetase alpha subunit